MLGNRLASACPEPVTPVPKRDQKVLVSNITRVFRLTLRDGRDAESETPTGIRLLVASADASTGFPG